LEILKAWRTQKRGLIFQKSRNIPHLFTPGKPGAKENKKVMKFKPKEFKRL